MEGLAERHGLRQWLGVLPGWNWLEDHEHDYDGWQPSVELERPGFKITFKLKDPRMLKEVARTALR